MRDGVVTVACGPRNCNVARCRLRRVCKKNQGRVHPARAARWQGDLDDGLVDSDRGLHTNAGTSAGFWQGRDEDLRLAQLRIARLHRSSNTKKPRPSRYWLHVKSEVEQTTQDTAPACPKGKR